MAGPAPFHQTRSGVVHEPPHGLAQRFAAQVNVAGQSENRKAQAGSSFESAMAEQIGKDSALGDGLAKARDQMTRLFWSSGREGVLPPAGRKKQIPRPLPKPARAMPRKISVSIQSKTKN